MTPGTLQEIGLIRQQSAVPFEFALKNRSDKPIRILDVATSCTCTTVEVSRPLMQPGESTKLGFRFNSESSRGTVDLRPIVVYQRHGSSEQHRLVLQAIGEIDPEVMVSHERLTFREGVAATTELTVWPHRADRLAIERVTSDARFIAARVREAHSARQRIAVTFSPDEYYRDVREAHLLIFSGPGRPVIKLPVEVQHVD